MDEVRQVLRLPTLTDAEALAIAELPGYRQLKQEIRDNMWFRYHIRLYEDGSVGAINVPTDILRSLGRRTTHILEFFKQRVTSLEGFVNLRISMAPNDELGSIDAGSTTLRRLVMDEMIFGIFDPECKWPELRVIELNAVAWQYELQFKSISYHRMPKLTRISINGVSCSTQSNVVQCSPVIDLVEPPSRSLQKHMLRLHNLWSVKTCVFLCLKACGLGKDVARLIASTYVRWEHHIVARTIPPLQSGHVRVDPEDFRNLKRLKKEHDKECKKKNRSPYMVDARRIAVQTYVQKIT